MTEPDEALLWAREERPTLPGIHLVLAHGYRAGAAASAERIKELEARVAELEAALKDSVTAMRLLRDAVQKHNAESDTLRSGFPLHVLSIEIGGVRSMLKEPDQ